MRTMHALKGNHSKSVLLKGLCCFMVGLVAFGLIAASLDDIGWTWDEVYYFESAQFQLQWANALYHALFTGNLGTVFSQKIIDEYWLWDIYHNPHPPLYKMLSGAGWVLFKNILGDFVAFRLSSAFLAAVLISVLYLTIEKKYGILPALYGACSLLFMPQFFGHAHIAATETPLMTFWFLCYWAFWRGLTHRSGSILLGCILGCALATKFTAVLIPVAFLVWSALFREKRAVRNIITAFILAPLVAILVNPGWWFQPLYKITGFIQASTSRHESIPISSFFLGTLYKFSCPWYYALFMLAVTIPITLCCTILLGIAFEAKEKFRCSYDLLFLLNIPVIIGITMLPRAPVHDGIRQFISVLPFLAYLSALGWYYLTEIFSSAISAGLLKKGMCAVALLSLILYPAYQVRKIHPYELCYYNELIGGVQGAYDRGMETTYWFDVFNKPFLDILNAKIPSGATVSVWPPNTKYFEFLQEKNKIKKDLIFPQVEINLACSEKGCTLKFTPKAPEYLIVMWRRSSLLPVFESLLKKTKPLCSLTLDGVPLISMYRW